MSTTETPATTPARERGDKAGKAERRTWPYRFELVPLDRLFIDADYQRPLTSFVESVAKDYDPALIGTLIVSERSGKRMAIIDGQTRWEATKMQPEYADVTKAERAEVVLPCLVYHALTREQEADLFADLQTKRRGMATYLRFRAALVAKKPEALAIAQIVTAAGFDLGVQETPHTVKAIAALEAVYRRDKDGPQMLSLVMQVISEAWPNQDTLGRTSGDMIRGLSIFLGREKNVDLERLRERLTATEPRTIRHRANALQEGSGSGTGGRAAYMADAILGVYLRGGKRASAAA